MTKLMTARERQLRQHWWIALFMVPLLGGFYFLIGSKIAWLVMIVFFVSSFALYLLSGRAQFLAVVLNLFLCLPALMLSFIYSPEAVKRLHLNSVDFAALIVWPLLATASYFGLAGAVPAWLLVVASSFVVCGHENMLIATIVLTMGAMVGVQRHRVLLDLERAEKNLAQVASTDPLTGLQNRRALQQRFEALYALCVRRNEPMLVSVWDLNHLKRINDDWGHAAGDAHLCSFANTLRGNLRGGDELFRVGGDEFVALHPGLVSGAELCARFTEEFLLGAAVGWARAEGDLELAMRQADAMMYGHKASIKATGEFDRIA